MISFESMTVSKVLSHCLRFSGDVAGYAASGLTQPTETIRVTEAGIKSWKRLTLLMENKTYSNKVGWDKRSVPNVLKEEFFL